MCYIIKASLKSMEYPCVFVLLVTRDSLVYAVFVLFFKQRRGLGSGDWPNITSPYDTNHRWLGLNEK